MNELIYFSRCCGGNKGSYGIVINFLKTLKEQGIDINMRKANHHDKKNILRAQSHVNGKEYIYIPEVTDKLVLIDELEAKKADIIANFKNKIEIQEAFKNKIQEK